MKIAVTGGSGKLGRTVVAVLGQAGHEVVNLDAVGQRGPGFVQVDLKDYGETVDALFGESDPSGGPDQAASTFEWVPEEAQVGEHVLIFRGAGACSMWVQVESGLVSVPSAPVQSSFSIIPRQPSDPWVDLRFGLASAQLVHLRVLDVHGRELAVLSRTSWEAGSHQVRWNARDISARPGVYWIEFRTAVERRVGKIVLVH